MMIRFFGTHEEYDEIDAARWPRRTPSLPDLLTSLMEQHGLSRADLVPLLGTPSRVSEVLNGKRELSISMVRKLRERFQISADLLISAMIAWTRGLDYGKKREWIETPARGAACARLARVAADGSRRTC